MVELKQAIKNACRELFDVEVEPELARPDEQFGDFSTNVAMQLATQLGKNPSEIAEQIAEKIDGAKAAGGFINIRFSDEAIAKMAFSATELPKPNDGKEILVEFGDPNPFKEMHIGHLYSYIAGETISRLLEASGADVKRLSYHGDVGLHIAKALYGLEALKQERESRGKSLSEVEADKVEDFMGIAYAYGHEKYESNPKAKTEIEDINQKIYAQNDPKIVSLHKDGIRLSFKYFDKVIDLLNTHNDKRYFESQSTPLGMKVVEENIGKVFEKSQDAVIFKGEEVGLHTRVFITSKHLPTYETKDLGLTQLKDKDFPKAKRSIVITATEQSEYFKVMLAALSEIKPELAAKTTHIAHGFLSLTTGKMSSRTGNVLSAQSLLDSVKNAVNEKYTGSKLENQVFLAATKYSMLKHRLGQDFVVDIQKSISLDGDSGPYLQYAHARAKSILRKSDGQPATKPSELDEAERSLARHIGEYPEVVAKASAELMPSHICTYLYDLSQSFNRFYEKARVIGDARQELRLALVEAYANVLKHGLGLLNIEAPEKV